MSYCLNPHCQKPQNYQDAKFCLTCGTKLLLKERYRAIKPIGQRTLLAVDEDKPSKPPCVIRHLQIIKCPNIGVALPDRTPVYLRFVRNICKKVRHFISWFWISLKKFLPQAQATNNSQKAAELFERKAERLDELSKHKQIPELLAYLTQEENQYLVQQYIDGHNLAQILAKQGTFKEQQIWQLLNSLLPLLEFIHKNDVIHRDIKPQNIIFRKNRQLYLVDFGTAKVVMGTAILQTGTSIGTPEFVAPEQTRGKAIYSSDLYSLGTTCIYLLTGISPFDLFDISENTWVWRQYLVDNTVSDKLGNILDKLIENATSRRYQSANEVLEDINFNKNNTSENKVNISNTTPKKAFNSPIVKVQSAIEVLKDVDSQKKNTSEKTEHISNTTPQKALNSPIVKCLNYSTWRYIDNFTGHTGSIDSVAISPDGNILVSGSHDCKIKLWEINTGKQLRTINNENIVYTIVFNPNGSIIASSGFDNKIQLWDVTSDKKICTLKGHIGWFTSVNSLSFSPDGRILASAGSDKTVKLWDVNTGSEIRIFTGHDTWVGSVAISPNGKTLASSSDDNYIKLWDMNKEKEICTLTEHSAKVNSMVFSPDAKTLFSGSEDKTIKVWRHE